MRKIFLFVFLAVALIVSGCATIQKMPSVCDTITEPSMLCEIAGKAGIRLEDMATGLVLVNEVAIIEGLYTREQANAVLLELRQALDVGAVSYAVYRLKIYGIAGKYNGLLDIAGVYLEHFAGQHQWIYSADRDLIRGWIDQQVSRVREMQV